MIDTFDQLFDHSFSLTLTLLTPLLFLLHINHRSHRSIFQVSSRLFYGGALEECAEYALVNSLSSFRPLPRDKSFPVLFIGTYV